MIGDFFNEHYREYDAWYEKNKWAYISELEAVNKVLPEGGRGLEVGVGSGRFAASLGIEMGIDPSAKMVELARSRGVSATVGVGEDLPFPDHSFDYVALIFTLCFVPDPEKVIEESKRVLRPKGKMIIGIVDANSALGRSYQKKESVFYDHARFFRIDEVVQMLQTAGFKHFSCYQTISEHPDRMRSVEEPQKGYGKGGFVTISAKKK